MAEITLVTGGARSGKSRFAQNLAETISAEKECPRIFIATSPILDNEMKARIQRHRRERSGRNWQTIEEEVDLLGVLTTKMPNKPATILLDCVTLWINNLLYRAENTDMLNDDVVHSLTAEIAEKMTTSQHRFIVVTGEVGLGIVPDNAEARHYRDLVGTANQCFAHFASKVILVSCGIPLCLKDDTQ